MSSRTNMSRRALLGAAGFGALGIATAAAASAHERPHHGHDRPGHGSPREGAPFHGSSQAGIATPIQASLQFAAIDTTVRTRADLVSLLRDWTAAAAQLTSALPVGRTGAVNGGPTAIPEDSGEALDLPSANLTVTFGFGPSLFRHPTRGDRFGILNRKPASLNDLPAFKGDALVASRTGGDLCIQACADDAQIAMHAVRNLMRVADGRATIRWTQAGFNRSASLDQVTTTPRNLFGFRDGTNNIPSSDRAIMDDYVWARGSDGEGWMDGGSYLAVRQIRMIIDTWDEEPLDEQEKVFGRAKLTGAPLSGGTEFTAPDFAKKGADGKALIDPSSHMALANPHSNGGVRILRRAFNYANPDDSAGKPDVGLFFMSYQRDLAKQYIPMQRKLAESDLMNEYIKHTASAVFAMPPGARGPGDFVGSSLLT